MVTFKVSALILFFECFFYLLFMLISTFQTMGLFSTSKSYSTIVNCQFPGYVLKNLGLRHFLLAGGGGAAKTGVRNEIQVCLFS